MNRSRDLEVNMVDLGRCLCVITARRIWTEVQFVREEYARMDQRLESLKLELDVFERKMAGMTEDEMNLQDDPVDLGYLRHCPFKDSHHLGAATWRTKRRLRPRRRTKSDLWASLLCFYF